MIDHALAELESAHCYAAEFGSVLEWCASRTDALFATPELTPWHVAEDAWHTWEARRVERVFATDVA